MHWLYVTFLILPPCAVGMQDAKLTFGGAERRLYGNSLHYFYSFYVSLKLLQDKHLKMGWPLGQLS